MLERKTDELFSEEALAKSLESARSWCRNNLRKCVRGADHKFDYHIFRYIVDNEQMSDMCLDPEMSGLIRVSQRNLDFLSKREAIYGEARRRVVDLESLFIHEIVEFILATDIIVYRQNCEPFPMVPHDVACIVENTNRVERRLKPWFHT